MLLFDRKFGRGFVCSVPAKAGVYHFRNVNREVVYIGKAKNLRRRLSQYRRARAGKMRKIVKAASSLEWIPCDSELQACLLELRLIQQEKPKLNLAGKFSFRYPMIGLRLAGSDCHLLFTTTPEIFAGYSFHGAFRSRRVTAEAFFGLIRLLQFVGHPMKKKEGQKPYSYEFGLRRFPTQWAGLVDRFLRGNSDLFLETLVMKLLENAGARAKAQDVQEGIDALKTFWKEECLPLAKVITILGYTTYPVPQTERDPLFVRAGFEGSL